MIEANLGIHLANGFQQPDNSQGGELARQHGLGETGGDETLGGQIVDLVGLGYLDRAEQRGGVEQVRFVQRELLPEVLDPLVATGTAAAYGAVDLVPFFQQHFGQVGTILPRNPRD